MISAFKSKFSLLSGALALSLLASTASASPINLVYDGPSVSGGQSNWETVKITHAPVTPAASNVYAYGFNMTDTTGTLGSFLAWCLDLSHRLSTSNTNAQPYTVTDTPFTNSFSVNVDRIQSVFDANFKLLDVTNGVQAAGFQVALWNAVYDTDWTVGGSVFAVAATDPAVIAQANSYLSAAHAYTGDQRYRLTFLQSTPGAGKDTHQNLVTVSPVPLPAAGILLLVAVGGLGVASRRRKAA